MTGERKDMNFYEMKLALILKEALALMDTDPERAERIMDIVMADEDDIKTVIMPNDGIGDGAREALRKAIKDNDGYCVCAVEKTPDTKCMCREFREDIASGPCHCGLYKKVAKTEDYEYGD